MTKGFSIIIFSDYRSAFQLVYHIFIRLNLLRIYVMQFSLKYGKCLLKFFKRAIKA